MHDEQLRPRLWNQYIGQANLKNRLEVYCADAKRRQRPLPHLLLAAPPGYGKTSLAALIADQVMDPFQTITLGPAFKQTDLQRFFSRFDGGVVLFDEAHRAPDRLQEELYNALEDGYYQKPNGTKIPLPWFTAIFATSEAQELLDPLLRRIPIKNLSFDPYSEAELAEIIQQMGERLDVTIYNELAVGLGRAAAGRPGEAVELVYAVRALTKNDEDDVTLGEVLAFCERDADGLTKQHRQLLAAIDKLGNGTGVGLDRLADFTGLHTTQIRSIENLLVERDLLIQGPAGRELTATGISRARSGQQTDAPDGKVYRERSIV